MADRGIEFFKFSSADIAKCKEIAGKPVRDAWAKAKDDEGLPGTELMNLFLEKVKKYEVELAAYAP